MNLIDLIQEKFEFLNKENIKFNDENNINEELKVSELQAHKILYFLYGYFWKEYEKELFKANFEAWKYGPVEVDFRKNKISKFDIKLNEIEKKFTEEKISQLLNYGVWFLVEQSHLTKPWIDNYSSEVNCKWKKIKNKEIKDFFK